MRTTPLHSRQTVCRAATLAAGVLIAASVWVVPRVAADVGDDAEPTTMPTVPTTRKSRPAQPVATAEELAQQAATLRIAYAKPPAEWPTPTLDPSVKLAELGPLPAVVHPANNPYSKEKAELGRALFFEPKLSGSGQFACVSCHNPELGWGDGLTNAFGHDRQVSKRNAPTVMNAAFKPKLFWDGRAASLEEQVLGPITTESEMHGDPKVAVERLTERPDYVKQFKAVFGDDDISIERVAMAIACYERTIVGGRSKFDRFLAGKADALSDDAVRGLHLFRTKAGCLNCHNGPNFSDGDFHNLGLSNYGRRLQDLGRYEQTKDAKDVGAFLTPSLRNVERTGPYMHTGLFEIDELLTLYNAGMFTIRRKPEQQNDPLFPTKSPLLKPLHLSKQEVADLKAFLFSLTEPKQRIRVVSEPAGDEKGDGEKQ